MNKDTEKETMSHTLEELDLARSIMAKLGHAVSPSREPGADRLVDEVAGMIARSRLDSPNPFPRSSVQVNESLNELGTLLGHINVGNGNVGEPKGLGQELVDFLRALRPEYGSVGSRDIDVGAKQKLIDRAIEIIDGLPKGDSYRYGVVRVQSLQGEALDRAKEAYRMGLIGDIPIINTVTFQRLEPSSPAADEVKDSLDAGWGHGIVHCATPEQVIARDIEIVNQVRPVGTFTEARDSAEPDSKFMMPLPRKPSPWKTGAAVVQSPDGSLAPYQPHVDQPTTWVDLPSFDPRSTLSISPSDVELANAIPSTGLMAEARNAAAMEHDPQDKIVGTVLGRGACNSYVLVEALDEQQYVVNQPVFSGSQEDWNTLNKGDLIDLVVQDDFCARVVSARPNVAQALVNSSKAPRP